MLVYLSHSLAVLTECQDEVKGVYTNVKHGPVEATLIEENGFTFKRKVTQDCELVCRFRKRTVELLRMMGPAAPRKHFFLLHCSLSPLLPPLLTLDS